MSKRGQHFGTDNYVPLDFLLDSSAKLNGMITLAKELIPLPLQTFRSGMFKCFTKIAGRKFADIHFMDEGIPVIGFQHLHLETLDVYRKEISLLPFR
jgi:hypothetical protein